MQARLRACGVSSTRSLISSSSAMAPSCPRFGSRCRRPGHYHPSPAGTALIAATISATALTAALTSATLATASHRLSRPRPAESQPLSSTSGSSMTRVIGHSASKATPSLACHWPSSPCSARRSYISLYLPTPPYISLYLPISSSPCSAADRVGDVHGGSQQPWRDVAQHPLPRY